MWPIFSPNVSRARLRGAGASDLMWAHLPAFCRSLFGCPGLSSLPTSLLPLGWQGSVLERVWPVTGRVTLGKTPGGGGMVVPLSVP